VLYLVHQPGPEGTLYARVGMQGSMKPLERGCMGQLNGLLERRAIVRLSLTNCGIRGVMYRGFERRATPRYHGARTAVIQLGPDQHIKCTVRDFSPEGVGVVLPATVSILLTEFDLTFGQTTRRCETVWRQFDRMGVKIRSTRFAS
jgi:hypothetical protein